MDKLNTGVRRRCCVVNLRVLSMCLVSRWAKYGCATGRGGRINKRIIVVSVRDRVVAAKIVIPTRRLWSLAVGAEKPDARNF